MQLFSFLWLDKFILVCYTNVEFETTKGYKMNNIDIVVKICKEGLTINQFFKICERYDLTNEQIQQAQALINNRTHVSVRLEK